jgi:hypothetical protein
VVDDSLVTSVDGAVAGETDRVRDGDGADDEGALTKDDLSRLQVPAGHKVLAEQWARLYLVRELLALELVLFPVLFLAALGAVEDRLARRALGLGRLLAHGTDAEVFAVKIFDKAHGGKSAKKDMPINLKVLLVNLVVSFYYVSTTYQSQNSFNSS